jgi:glycosyltransferase involved in cell wall biosynthesis
MKLLVKLALMRIKLKRKQKSANSINQAGEPFTGLQEITDPFIKEMNQIIKVLGLIGKERNRIINIRENVSKIKNSLSWKLGNGFVSVYDKLIFRKKSKSVFDKIDKEADILLNVIANGLDNSPEPVFYLNPAFLVPPKTFNSETTQAEKLVSIIVLHKDSPGILTEFFDSFLQHVNFNACNLSLVDFNTDGKGLSTYNKFKSILPLKYYYHEAFSTFACAANAAVEGAPSRYTMFLRSDIIIKDDVIHAILKHFEESPQAGIIGTILNSIDNKGKTGQNDHYAGYRFIEPSRDVNGPDDPRAYYHPELISGPVKTSEAHDLKECAAVSGNAMMVRTDDFIAVGGFDENYLAEFADVDLCLKIRHQAKKKIFLSNDIMLQCRNEPGLDFATVFPGQDNHDLFLLTKNFGKLIKNSFGADGSVGDVKKMKIAIKIPIPNNSDAEKWGDYYFSHSLAKALEKTGFSVRIDYFSDWYQKDFQNDEIALVLRGLSRYYPVPGQMNLMWNISHPDMVSDEEYESFDHVFVASKKQAEILSRRLSVPVSVLYQCTDPELFYPDPDPEIPLAQFLYVSNYRLPQRIASAYFINNHIPVDVYGRNWKENIPDIYIKGDFIPNNQLRKYYSRCSALLNDHWMDMAQLGFVSNRLFDSIACGCPVISDQCDGIQELFGESVITYASEEDFIRAIDKITQNPSKFKKIAENHAHNIKGHHTFDNRAAEIYAVVKNYA